MRTAPQIAASVLWLSSMTACFLLDDPRRRFPAYALTLLIAGVSWLILLRQPPRWAPWLGLLPHVLALLSTPAFSEDAFRYVYEGRLAWAMGPAFPFLVPPAEGPVAGVPPELFDSSWLRINHPELPTLYPPLSQLAFMLVALTPLPPLLGLQLLNMGAALGAARLLERRGLSGWVWIWLCPLVVVEGVREAHVDGLTLLFGAWATSAWLASKAGLGHAGFALSALCKLAGGLGLVVGGRRDPRALAIGAGVAAAIAWPLVVLGPSAARGGLAYAGRWQGGEGVFGLLLAGAQTMLGGDWARIGSQSFTAQQLARGALVLLFVFVMALRLRVRPEAAQVPVWTGQLLLLALLLSPTLHPWYVLGILPFAAAGAWPASAAGLALTAPLLHHASWVELMSGHWTPASWPRLVVHGVAWSALLGIWARNRGLGAGTR